MSSKILVATAIMAAGSFMFIDTADAQRRGGGAERGGNANAEAGGRRGGARQNRRNRQAGQAQGQRRNAGARNGTRRNANRARNQQRNGEGNRNARRSEQNAQARRPRTTRAPKHVDRRPQRQAPRGFKGWGLDLGGLRPRWTERYGLRNTWRRLPWVGRGNGGRSCTAVARTNGGDGRTLRNTFGDGYGRRACRKAMNACNLKLDRRQARGRNPYARCVIASR